MKSLNEASIRQSHPQLPPYQKAMLVPENTYKTVTDAWEGFHGIPLEHNSKKLTQFITPWGSYRYLRGPQGYSTTGDAYNMRFDEVTKDFPNVIRQTDDSLLWNQYIRKNFHRSAEYFTLLGRSGILQNPVKLQFCQRTATWLGFELGDNYVRPMAHISSALSNFPVPANKTDLRAFMALAQQVSYATAVAPKLLPFRSLLKKEEVWNWTPELNSLFLATREVLAKQVEEGIKSYDPKKTTALITDFCKHGVGFLLMQKHCPCRKLTDAGKLNTLCCRTGWKVCMVGSRFTKKPEANYCPTEGELLGVVNALQKTKYFTLCCPDLYIGTDHKPLLGLLKNSDLDDNPRLLKLKEKTTGWKFDIVYIPGKEIGRMDALSRYGVRHGQDDCEVETSVRKHMIGLIASSDEDEASDINDETEMISALGTTDKPVSWEMIKRYTSLDDSLSKVVQYVKSGFPETKDNMPEGLGIYWRIRQHLSSLDGVLLYGECVVVPEDLRGAVLEVLHSAHQGVTAMSLRANISVYWPGMYTDIVANGIAVRSVTA